MSSNTYCNTNHILIGLGGTGGKILRAFKMRMFEEFPDSKEREKQSVQLLYVDSSKEMMPKDGKGRADFRVMGQDASFTNEEFLFIKGNDVSYILDHIDSFPSVKGIVKNAQAVKSAIGNLGEAAGQMRRAGRLLFASNAVAFVNALQNAFARCAHISGNESELYIHIFAGLAGGTGSGSIIDAIVQCRKYYPDAVISVYAMIPEMHLPKANMDQGRYYQNGYAAINELNALQAGRYIPHDITGSGDPINYWSARVHGVANGITLYSNVNDNGLRLDSLNELPKVVSDYIFARVFLINSQNKSCEDIIRGYNFENMNNFEVEYDELGDDLNINEEQQIARTKKVNSFGIKRVMYPELRVLKHITYTTGESILMQFKYNNWREEMGFVDEEANKDYREKYFNDKNIQKWMLDDDHLTLNKKILASDKDQQDIDEYWHDKSLGYANDQTVKKADCPLNELDSLLGEEFFAKQFRGVGVEAYYAGKNKSIPDMAAEIRRNIEHELFELWKSGDVSIVELQKVSKLLIEKVTDIRQHIEDEIQKNEEDVITISDDCKANVAEWSDLNLIQRLANKGDRIYARHQNDLADLYSARTYSVALQFAKSLALKTLNAVQNMDSDIGAFAEVINKAIKETEALISAQQKINKGIEDMRGAIVEVSEEETMKEFEVELKLDKTEMPAIATQLRQAILPQAPFTNFGRLATDVSIDNIRDAFDIKLSEIVRAKHNEKAESDKKVLGMNIITQLQQKLQTEEDIRSFAFKIVQQSGVYLKLNNDQIQLHVRNNEGDRSPSNPASINKKAILVSIPKPKTDSQKTFAEKLEKAFKASFEQGTAITTLSFDMTSPRENELSIVTISYCYPMRCADWLATYRAKYESFLNTGNKTTDRNNAILLHTEEDGAALPSLFVVENAEEIIRQRKTSKATATQQPVSPAGPIGPGTPPPPPSGSVPPVPPTPQPVEPQVQMMLFVGGQQYGPYDYKTLKQFVPTKQLTPETLVWQQGMAAWTPAGQVPELQGLFAPVAPPAPPTPGVPPAPGVPPTPGL
jgi:hypothetical protein